MSRYSKCLFTAFAVLLLGIATTPCRAQDEGQLLHAGLLGYTGGIENQAMLLSAADFGQIYPGEAGGTGQAQANSQSAGSHPDWSFGLRFWNHSKIRQDIDDLNLGISATKNINEYLSARVSLDDLFSDNAVSNISLNTTALFQLPAGTLLASDVGYFNPYFGIGLDVNFFNSSGAGHSHGVGVSTSHIKTGFHYLLGIEYVFSNSSPLGTFYLGLEYSWRSSNDTHSDHFLHIHAREWLMVCLGFHF